MTSEAAHAARRERRREGLDRLVEIAPAEEVLDGPPCLSCGHANPHPAVDGCSFASCGCTAQTWVPCPTRVCAPELTKRNCLSCPGLVQTCPTCNGDGTVPNSKQPKASEHVEGCDLHDGHTGGCSVSLIGQPS